MQIKSILCLAMCLPPSPPVVAARTLKRDVPLVKKQIGTMEVTVSNAMDKRTVTVKWEKNMASVSVGKPTAYKNKTNRTSCCSKSNSASDSGYDGSHWDPDHAVVFTLSGGFFRRRVPWEETMFLEYGSVLAFHFALVFFFAIAFVLFFSFVFVLFLGSM